MFFAFRLMELLDGKKVLVFLSLLKENPYALLQKLLSAALPKDKCIVKLASE